MIDDTRNGGAVSGSDDSPRDFAAEVIDLIQLRSDRDDAYIWARDLKLLAFDEDIDHADATTPYRLAQCGRCTSPRTESTDSEGASTQPTWGCDTCRGLYRLQERFHCRFCNDGDYDLCRRCVAQGAACPDPGHTLSYSPEICEHLLARSCRPCQFVPPFPSAGPVESFRVIRQSSLPKRKEDSDDPLEQCTHFVAVSYCWPHEDGRLAQRQDACQGRYTVRDVDSRGRPNRAPEWVLDRAVAFARERGFRLLWIDQVNSDSTWFFRPS
jgi:hypothetical protein